MALQTNRIAFSDRRLGLIAEPNQGAALGAAGFCVRAARTVTTFATQLLDTVGRVLQEELALGSGRELRGLRNVALGALRGSCVGRLFLRACVLRKRERQRNQQ
jgi:hypothetical protein